MCHHSENWILFSFICKKAKRTPFNITNTMSSSDQQILLIVTAISSYASGTLFILGTVGNIINMIVFFCLKTYRSLVTSIFLAATAFTGQVYLIFSLGIGSLSKWIGLDLISRNSAVCKAVLYIRNVAIIISLTCLCLSSIERCLMTSRSARQREWMTLKRARLLVCFFAVISMCIGIPHAIHTNTIPAANLCSPTSDFATGVTSLNLIFVVTLPVGILTVFGLLTWKNLGNIRLTALNSQVWKYIE